MIYLEKQKSMDEEEPQNEPGTSSTSQPLVPIKDQQPVHRDQLTGTHLKTKTVSLAMSTVHEVRTLERQCFTRSPYLD